MANIKKGGESLLARPKKFHFKKMKTYLLRGVAVIACLCLGWLFVQQHKQSQTSQAQTLTTDSTDSFIASIGENARQISREHNIYASVMIAQAILESNHGTSALSQAPYHNLFGIKGSYEGHSVSLSTLEDDGTGQTYQIEDSFRVYPSYLESMTDYANLLSSQSYSGTWRSQTTSYQDATQALTGHYATDTSYASKLNKIIETYQLTSYDY